MPKPGRFATYTRTQMTALMTLIAIGIIVASLALLGIPGAIWMIPARPLAALFTARHAPADSIWPMMILHSILWPLFIPLAYLIAARHTAPGRPRSLRTLLLTAAAAILLGVVFQLNAGLA